MFDPSSSTHGKKPVIAALIGNVFVTVIKFAGASVSQSGALFSEAIHSSADTFNQLLLIIGIKKSTKQADEDYVYGYGQERFVWALISACGIFFVGAGVTIYKGINALIHEEIIYVNSIVFFILIISFVVEIFTLYLALRELKYKHTKLDWLEIFKQGDPSTIAVVYEDSVAVLGVLLAALSIWLTKITGEYYWDAWGSIVIGVLLGAVAVMLIQKNRQFLNKKAIPDEMQEEIIEILLNDPLIEKVFDFKSAILNMDEYLIKCEVEINGSALMKEMSRYSHFKEEYQNAKESYTEFLRFCADYADQIPRLIGTEIDKIEKKIVAKFPQIKHIDIEIN